LPVPSWPGPQGPASGGHRGLAWRRYPARRGGRAPGMGRACAGHLPAAPEGGYYTGSYYL